VSDYKTHCVVQILETREQREIQIFDYVPIVAVECEVSSSNLGLPLSSVLPGIRLDKLN
jgi:hypothetical protein